MDDEAIYKWIDGYTITRQKKCINRDFSDAVPIAEILKVHYPKLVDLHNYSPKNAFNLKLVNWQTLNRKVLNKINYNLDNESMIKLAQAVPGAIEKVLFDIKRKIDEKEEKKKENEDELLLIHGFNPTPDSVCDIKVKNGTKVLTQKLLPADTYEKIQRDLTEKDETILTLRNKVQHLEALLSIKDERINDLTRQVKKNGAGDSPKLKRYATKFDQNL